MLKNVKTMEKGVGNWYQDGDIYTFSSDVKVYNLFEQSWTDLQAEGLTHLFNGDQAEFERKKEVAAVQQND